MDFPGGAGIYDMHHQSGTTTPSSGSASGSGSGRSELSPDTSASRSLAQSQQASFDDCFPEMLQAAPVSVSTAAANANADAAWAMPAPPATSSGMATDTFDDCFPEMLQAAPVSVSTAVANANADAAWAKPAPPATSSGMAIDTFDDCFPEMLQAAPVSVSTAVANANADAAWAMPAPPATSSGLAIDTFGSKWPFNLLGPQDCQLGFDDPLPSSFPCSASTFPPTQFPAAAPAAIPPRPALSHSDFDPAPQRWQSSTLQEPGLCPPGASPLSLALAAMLLPGAQTPTFTPIVGGEFRHSLPQTQSPLTLEPPSQAPMTGQNSATFSRPQPTRRVSASALSPGRRPSSTLVSATSVSSETPQSAYLPFSSYPYPYPSARNSLPAAGPSTTRRISLSTAMGGAALGAGVKRVIHPSPASEERRERRHEVRTVPVTPEGEGALGKAQAERRASRFKPTKEQLGFLVGAYELNRNPDAATREKIARQLGPDVTGKTLQIWFQNRRSKSRAKERELMNPKVVKPSRASPTISKTRVPDMDGLRRLTRDDDPALVLLPLTLFNVSAWYRFLGFEYASVPEVGGALYVPPPGSLASPLVHLYAMYNAETFRVTLPFVSSSVTDLIAIEYPGTNNEVVSIRFVLAPRVAAFSRWCPLPSESGQAGGQIAAPGEQGVWEPVDDFTEGDATTGGRCELSGPREALVSAFSRLGPQLPLNFSRRHPDEPVTSSISGYNTPAAPPSAWQLALWTSSSQSQSQSQSERSSFDFSALQLTSPSAVNPALGAGAGADSFARQRSLSAPIVPGTQNAFGMFAPFALGPASANLPAAQDDSMDRGSGGSSLMPDKGSTLGAPWTSGLLSTWTLPPAKASISAADAADMAGIRTAYGAFPSVLQPATPGPTAASGTAKASDTVKTKAARDAFPSVLQPVPSGSGAASGTPNAFPSGLQGIPAAQTADFGGDWQLGSVPMSQSLAQTSLGGAQDGRMGPMGSSDGSENPGGSGQWRLS